MAKTEQATVRATESFVCRIDGADLTIRVGDSIAADHPAVRKYAQFFTKAEQPRVEQATAAPGEQRNARLAGLPKGIARDAQTIP